MALRQKHKANFLETKYKVIKLLDVHNFRIKNSKEKKINDYSLSDKFHIILINKEFILYFLQVFFEFGR
jgi:hypothetical protein